MSEGFPRTREDSTQEGLLEGNLKLLRLWVTAEAEGLNELRSGRDFAITGGGRRGCRMGPGGPGRCTQ